MLSIIITVLPIFFVVMAGWLMRRYGLITDGFLPTANKLIFYFSFPLMIFHSISQYSFFNQFQPVVVGIVICSIVITAILVVIGLSLAKTPRNRRGSFIQCCTHGNQANVGLAVCFYYLSAAGFATGSIIMGFTVITQNIISTYFLSYYGINRCEIGHDKTGLDGRPCHNSMVKLIAKKLATNPMIIATVLGILASISGLPIPKIATNFLDIVSKLALPLALLIVGASLSFKFLRDKMAPISVSVFIKLMFLPGLSFLLFNLFSIAPDDYLPALIMMAVPTATVSFVMASQMNGDPEFTAAVISCSTVLSMLSFIFWLTVANWQAAFF